MESNAYKSAKKLKNYHDIIEFLIYNIISRQQL